MMGLIFVCSIMVLPCLAFVRAQLPAMIFPSTATYLSPNRPGIIKASCKRSGVSTVLTVSPAMSTCAYANCLCIMFSFHAVFVSNVCSEHILTPHSSSPQFSIKKGIRSFGIRLCTCRTFRAALMQQEAPLLCLWLEPTCHLERRMAHQFLELLLRQLYLAVLRNAESGLWNSVSPPDGRSPGAHPGQSSITHYCKQDRHSRFKGGRAIVKDCRHPERRTPLPNGSWAFRRCPKAAPPSILRFSDSLLSFSEPAQQPMPLLSSPRGRFSASPLKNSPKVMFISPF